MSSLLETRKNWEQFQLQRDQRHNNQMVPDWILDQEERGKREEVCSLFAFVMKDFFFFTQVAKREKNLWPRWQHVSMLIS